MDFPGHCEKGKEISSNFYICLVWIIADLSIYQIRNIERRNIHFQHHILPCKVSPRKSESITWVVHCVPFPEDFLGRELSNRSI